ncbi:pyridoxal phosphate-dependent aminotransferase [Sandaracinobacteroides saxicola]|uniref:aspartate transaminase n=1 Tax=Sandaracinobacteroides saxicola TaxID=2759707 RepID=A0A7G5IJ72_9SPHN|nr:aminotransferase class I/II-fold pyridoxal phosphate-dependent enzyme [Sandaracinobacteroides saxicola]QMW23414.1 aminotransferase class I/II-fold pyridoxal phosphate-dependent enzyme [Sandaracinobacteroides saxicola]
MPPEIRLSARAAAMRSGGDAWWVAGEAMRRAAAGQDIIALTIGDPAGPPPDVVVAATIAALEAGRTHYSPLLGEPVLQRAIADYLNADAVRRVEPGQVAVMPGAQHALLGAMAMIAGPGDEVILLDPFYPSYPAVVAASGASPVFVGCGPGFAFDVETIVAAITPRTRAILINSPANPSGQALDAGDWAALVAATAAAGIWLVSDEVYARFRFDGDHVGVWDAGAPERSVLLGSLSKSHRMTGYRLGWAAGPPALVRALEDWSAASLFGVSQFVQDAGVAALAVPRAALEGYWRGFAERAARVVARANAIPGLRAAMPAGGMFVMLDVRGVDGDDVRFARALLDATGVAVTPGSGFGRAAAGHVRVSLCSEEAVLMAAFDRIEGWRAGLARAA